MIDVEKIKALLSSASEADALARTLRKNAGKLLAIRRSENSRGSAWYREAGLDLSTAELLVRMGIDHDLYQ